MKVLIVYAHPEPKSFSGALFCHAIRALEQAGHTVMTSDLYAMGFDPVSDRRNFTAASDPDFLKLQLEELAATEQGSFAPQLEQEMQKLEAADLLIFQFPLWWFGLPAILKGWVDRVFAMGRVYGQGHIYESGKFRGKRALLSLTTGGPAETYLPDGFNGDIDGVLRPIQRGILQFVGFDVLRPHICYAPVRVSQEEREAWLAQWAERLGQIEQESPIAVGRYQ
ncbi:NAD(P)H-dependent oxidoreductase [Aeromonas veronii]|uniref:NAD(P)H-dependent oxidoreductase n=1 Tax=Aeromonas TaxID=642 RepID=UPI0011A310A7|nr:NAD(P)H-dependent oxidoreductase [Aeromonas veronii]